MGRATFCFTLKSSPQIVSASEDTEALLGFRPANFLTAKIDLRSRVHPEDAGLAASLFSPEDGETSGSVNLRIRHADGRIRCFKVRYAKKRARKAPAQLELSLEDARKVSEPGDAQLIASFRTLIEQTGDFIYIKNRNHVILAASRGLPAITESALNAAELVGKTDYDIHPEAIADSAYRLEERAFAEGQRVNEAQQVPTQDGSTRWVDNRKYPINGPDGTIIGLLGIAPDITEHLEKERRLRESEESLREAQRIAGLGSYTLDIPSQTWKCSEILDEILGIGRAHEHTTEEWLDLVHPGDRAAIIAYFQNEVLGQGKPFDKEYRIVRSSDGVERWVRGWGELTFDAQGRPVKMHGAIKDITESKQAEERLRLAAKVFTGAREGISITDPEGTILDVNDAFTRITGYSREEALGQNPRILQSGLHNQNFYRNMWDCLLRDGQWSGEIWNRTKGGDIYPETLSIHAIRDAGGVVRQYVGLFTDITEVKQHEQQLEFVARYDALTELPNRVLFADRMRQAMAQARRSGQLLGVVYLDLDGFKAINDVYGHASGDALLAALAFKMKYALPEGDTLARLGGDEFAAVILNLPDRDACLAILERMLEAAAEEVQIGDVPLRVTASAGVAFYPQAEEIDADTLLRQAGQALYAAKLDNKSRFHVFDPSQDLIIRKRNESIEHVRRALHAQELVLYYQPKVNMRTGEVIGAEALLRWQHPERGLLPPGLFLPVIEDHPLIVEVGQWVIESALAQMEAWQDKGFEISVSVNVSAFELQHPDFFTHLCGRLSAHPRMDPSRLELEVLETSALQNVLQASQVLAACRELGLMISVDDFGTGYSSLAYLKRLPANALKIDGSFVRDMLDDPESLTILKGIVGLAEAFRWQVIAEGVETVEHGLMLLQLGCDCAQGYGIAKPMPAWELPAWAAAWRADPRWGETPVVHAGNRAVLFAATEHRAWYGHFLAYLQGTRLALHSLDASQCSISEWIELQRTSAGSLQPAVQAIETIHQQLHALAVEIYSAHTGGRKQDGLGLLRQLRYLHERCLKRLQPFIRVSSHKSSRYRVTREAFADSESSLT
jgi:diguanylate cyclase (GGDEF)-like protein/PAS domain S-box-containing protein